MSDQDKISPLIINTKSSKHSSNENIKKISIKGSLVNPIYTTFSELTSLELYSMVNSKERY